MQSDLAAHHVFALDEVVLVGAELESKLLLYILSFDEQDLLVSTEPAALLLVDILQLLLKDDFESWTREHRATVDFHSVFLAWLSLFFECLLLQVGDEGFTDGLVRRLPAGGLVSPQPYRALLLVEVCADPSLEVTNRAISRSVNRVHLKLEVVFLWLDDGQGWRHRSWSKWVLGCRRRLDRRLHLVWWQRNG